MVDNPQIQEPRPRATPPPEVVAWDGLELKVPSTWKVSGLASGYLRLDNISGPGVELRWFGYRRPLDQHGLEKLLRRQRRSLKLAVEPLSAAWNAALASFEAKGLRFGGGNDPGTGVALHCPSCGKVTLVHFHALTTKEDECLAQDILRSLRDHRPDGMVRWRLFGIELQTPAQLHLVQHHFVPGYFELLFAGDGVEVGFRRWGPAHLVLAGRDLEGWLLQAEQMKTLGVARSLASETFQGCTAARWQRREVGRWGRRYRRQGRAWVVSPADKILAVTVKGRDPELTELLDALCADYGAY